MSLGNFAILPGPSSIQFARSMAKQMNCDVIDVEFKEFADGENYFRLISEVKDLRVILVQSLSPPVDHHLMQMLFLAKKLSESGAIVYAVSPYLGYSRQHREFISGEIMSLRVVGHLMSSVNIKRLLTIDIHNVEGLGLFPFPAFSSSAISLLAEYVSKNEKISDAFIVSPDFGSSVRVETFAKFINRPYCVLEKERDRVTGVVKVRSPSVRLEGKTAYIVDDMISSGGTIAKAANVLSDFGVKDITAVCVHPVLVAGAMEKMTQAGVTKLIATNTIQTEYSRVDASKAIVDHLKMLG
ncbi:MAG: ribose-phosphate diphosphokinase [Nitrososphaeria archaeon]